jgi:hypothetical protein
MRKFLLAAAAMGVTLLVAPRSHAQGEAKAIIEKAIKAHGGADKLAKTKAMRTVSKGTVDVMGQTLPFKETNTMQQPGQFRSEVVLELGGQQVTILIVGNGNDVWINVMGNTMDAPYIAKDEIKNALYAGRVGSLTPLLEDKEFKLSLLGEAKIKGKPAIGVKVSRSGQKDIDLYFDKESNLVARVVRPVLDQAGQDVIEERTFSDYKDVEGLKRPMKVLAERGGQKYAEAEVIETKYFDKIDANEFSKP